MNPKRLVQLEVAQRRVRVCWRCGREWPVAREMCPECAVGIAAGERDRYYTHVVADGAALRSQMGLTQCWPGPPIHLATAFVLYLTIEGLPSSERVGGVLEEHLLGICRIICSDKGWIDSTAAGDLRALFPGEDHALQAVRAGLALLAFHCTHPPAIGWEIKWRAGINTGLVVWRRDGRPEGRTLAIAAELVPLARPGVILVSEAVLRHVQPFYDLVAVGVEGDTSGSAPRYAVLGPKVENSHALHEQHGGPLIGRQDALAALDAALAALHAGMSQIVSLVAEPGLGKSKLITAWLEAARQRGALAGMAVLQGLGVAYGSTPGTTVRSLLRPWGKASAAAPEEINSLIEGGFLTPPTRIADALTAWLARQRQVVLVVDDLHWTDDESLAVLRALLERSLPVPLLVVFSFRPSAAARLAWVLSASRLVLYLTPLSLSESQALLHASGGADVLPAAMSQALAARAGGNPLYLEEALAFVHDQRAQAPGELRAALTELPATLPGLILARVEHFAARRIAQLSSGFGWLTQHPFERQRRLDEVTTIERELSAWLDRLEANDYVDQETIARCLRRLEQLDFELLLGRLRLGQPRPRMARLAAAIERLAGASVNAHLTLLRERLGQDRLNVAHEAATAGDRAWERGKGEAARAYYELALLAMPSEGDPIIQRPRLWLRVADLAERIGDLSSAR